MSARLLVLCTCLFLLMHQNSHAQIPVPEEAPARTRDRATMATDLTDDASDAPLSEDTLPEEGFASDFLVPEGETNKTIKPIMRYPGAREAAVQQKRQRDRALENRLNGYQWMPFDRSGQKTLEFLQERKANIARLREESHYIDIAISDVDYDGKPDILLSYWDQFYCGTTGCSFDVYFGNSLRQPMYIKAHRIAPHPQGILIDDSYYSLR